MIAAVLFDLDGTLADTAPDLGLALNRLLAEEGFPAQPYEQIRPVASHGARGLIGLGFGIGPEHPDFPRLRDRFLDLYAECCCVETRLFDGIEALLQTIVDRGLHWGIVTNKPARFTDPPSMAALMARASSRVQRVKTLSRSTPGMGGRIGEDPVAMTRLS